MDAIWAKGQEAGNYIHNPRSPSGIERGSGDPNFYREDEFKYHGHVGNRGRATLNFFGESEIEFKAKFVTFYHDRLYCRLPNVREKLVLEFCEFPHHLKSKSHILIASRRDIFLNINNWKHLMCLYL